MKKGLEGLEKGSKAEIHIDLHKTTLKKYQTGKRQAMMEYMVSGLKFTSIHDRLTLEMNTCLQGEHVPEWMTKGKTTLILKDPIKDP